MRPLNKKIHLSDFQIINYSIKCCKILKIKNCLSSSVTVFFILRMYGHNPVFYLGAGYVDDKFISHSWIKLNKIIFQTNNQEIDKLNVILSI